jgi:hypothetical protein
MPINFLQTNKTRAYVIALILLIVSLCTASADELVYKCGQEITNKPANPQQCQKLETSVPTQIEGTRVQATVSTRPRKPTTEMNLERAEMPPSDAAASQQRALQARTILEDEWQKLSAKQAEMVRLYNQGVPALLAGETIHAPEYKQRVLSLKSQLQRIERDIQALQRELSRQSVNLDTAQTK